MVNWNGFSASDAKRGGIHFVQDLLYENDFTAIAFLQIVMPFGFYAQQ